MIRRIAITVRGIVQGVGFRPFIFNLAQRERLSGCVTNETDAVRIEAIGPDDCVERFVAAIHKEAPPQSRIDQLDVQPLAVESADYNSESGQFQILHSRVTGTPSPTIPADLCICSECLAEIRDPQQRRFRYPFTNCTNCGPRWSIITQLPYDRSRTSMERFAMCDQCRAEYDDPTDRRFHAQPIACRSCGPELRLLSNDGQEIARGDDALIQGAEAARRGEIIAMLGLGGFQLVTNACDQQAVERLRQRKQRPRKPFAVMLADSGEVELFCDVSVQEQQLLQSYHAPIVLLRKRPRVNGVRIADSVASGNPYLGVMLPYTPLHYLMMDTIKTPIICTSGNRSEEPMAISTDDALERLAGIADWTLTHDRPVVRPVDDSVVQVIGSHPQVIRRARGYAPRTIRLKTPLRPVLAVGGHLKNTVALGLGSEVLISPHVGDLDNRLGVESHERAIDDLLRFFQFEPEAIACDLHPDYRSTRVAERLANDWRVPLVRVQHHHAHLLSVVGEHDLHGPVLGLIWDGTGFGLDGTVWGGEALLLDDGRTTRVAHLRTFSLPGGDRAVREPVRTSLGLLYEMSGVACQEFVEDRFNTAQLATLFTALERGTVFPRCSSMGRLFDAVAALCGFRGSCSFEGEAAIGLEYLANETELGSYPMPLSNDEPAVADWEPLIRCVIADRAAGYSEAIIASRFHRSLANMAFEIAKRFGVRQVVLSGGCFLNRLLYKQVMSRLSELGVDVYTQRDVPPGDGGIALGQIIGAMQQVGG